MSSSRPSGFPRWVTPRWQPPSSRDRRPSARSTTRSTESTAPSGRPSPTSVRLKRDTGPAWVASTPTPRLCSTAPRSPARTVPTSCPVRPWAEKSSPTSPSPTETSSPSCSVSDTSDPSTWSTYGPSSSTSARRTRPSPVETPTVPERTPRCSWPEDTSTTMSRGPSPLSPGPSLLPGPLLPARPVQSDPTRTADTRDPS